MIPKNTFANMMILNAVMHDDMPMRYDLPDRYGGTPSRRKNRGKRIQKARIRNKMARKSRRINNHT